MVQESDKDALIEELRSELQRVKLQLKRATMGEAAYKELVRLAEEHFHIQIKKKSNLKP